MWRKIFGALVGVGLSCFDLIAKYVGFDFAEETKSGNYMKKR